MATTSQKMMEMRFLVLIRGALTPPPMMDEPVMRMPLGRSAVACDGEESAPCGADDGQADAETDAHGCP
jgi:hypothetical protein